MVDWTDPDPFELKVLHEALRFAYPFENNFSAFLYFNLGKAYGAIVPGNLGYYEGLLYLLQQAHAGGWLNTLVQKALLDKPASPKLITLKRSLALTPVEQAHALAWSLEDIVRREGSYTDLTPWVERLGALGARTCRIEYPINTAVGSGWLVGPDLMLTNWHVIDKALPGGQRRSAEYACRFDYAVTAEGTQGGTEVRFAENWCVDASPPSPEELGTGNEGPSADTLDYALVRLAAPVGKQKSSLGSERGWVALKGDEALPAASNIVMVLQYPDGFPLKLALGNVTESDSTLRFFHTADTKGGSSGALVVNASLSPVGLHHAGDLQYHRGRIGKPEKNQAVPLGPIVQSLRAKGYLQ
jgi:V8-like Glu-specific endopeptidase